MRLRRAGLFLFLLLLIQNASAAELKVIELTDGSTIAGEVLSLANGVYTIKSDSLGTVKLEASQIRTIRATSSGANAASTQEVKALTEKMLSDQEIMVLIQSLQNDPDFKKVLEDPVIMKAVSEGDISALTANPRFMKLLDNATVKAIGQKAR
jgi:hypothetical protein